MHLMLASSIACSNYIPILLSKLFLHLAFAFKIIAVRSNPNRKHVDTTPFIDDNRVVSYVARDTISQQHVYKLCIGIDLVHDNQYWTILINNATRECSIDPIHKAHLIWSNKNTTLIMELQNFM